MENTLTPNPLETDNRPPPTLASFWDRYAAFVIDNLILFPIILGLIIIQGISFYSRMKGADWSMLFQNPELFETRYGSMFESGFNTLASFMQILTWIYFVYFTYKNKATPGKKLLKLEVLNSERRKLPLLNIILRETVGKIVSSFVFNLGYAWVIWDKKKQGWHDKIAQSYVYRVADNKRIKTVVIGVQIVLIILTMLGFFAAFSWAWKTYSPLLEEGKYKDRGGSYNGSTGEMDIEDILKEYFPDDIPVTPSPLPGNIT